MDKLVGVEILMYNTGDKIIKAINNCGEYVDRIYIAYSEYNWGYNGLKIKNTTSLDILRDNRYFNKIRVIEGNWDKDEGSRNACLDAAKEEGMGYLVIQDADEYYRGKEYKRLIESMKDKEEFHTYKVNMLQFWKNWDNVLIGKYNNKITLIPDFGIKILKDSTFIYSRITAQSRDINNMINIGGICYHGTLVLSDEEVRYKIDNWAHSKDFNKEEWFKNKWKAWETNKEITDLHYFIKGEWLKTEKWEGWRPN